MTIDIEEEVLEDKLAKGRVVKAFGNLIQVEFDGHIRQGEVAMVVLGDVQLKGEVIEIIGNEAKIQVYEDTRDIQYDTPVLFTGDLLEAELGPGLLSSIVDGLENPLVEIANDSGLFLPRGIYLPPIDRQRLWDYHPKVTVGQVVERGDTLGITQENRFQHHVMVPFAFYGKCEITWVIGQGSYTVETVVAKAKDESGKEFSFTMLQNWPIRNRLFQGEKVKPSRMLKTGCRIIDTQFPIMKGGTFCTPGPFGAGKTVLQHQLSKYAEIDVVVVVACGERAGEVVELLREFPHLIDPHTGDTLMKRTVIICNTSSMPVAARESSIYMGITVAEYYRQMGLNILVLADSTSRWAQALREMSGRLEEIPGDEAFPAYLASRIAQFYERSGVVSLKDGKYGSITICGAVSPAGGNFEEPVTQATLSVVGAFLGLSKERSDSRRYPAIDPLISWSKYVAGVGKELEAEVDDWTGMVKKAAYFIRMGNEIGKRMEVVGEEGTAIQDIVIYLKSEMYDFSYLQQNFFDKEDGYFSLKRQIILFTLINKIFDAKFTFQTHDEARQYFLTLQNSIKNMNFLPFDSHEYRESYHKIEKLIRREVQ
jgi:V/A-type H+-transporting ATPase subunit A